MFGKKIIPLLLPIIITHLVACKKHNQNVVIVGKLLHAQKGDIVEYMLPIDGFANYILPSTTKVYNDSGEFKITANLDSAGFIAIRNSRGRIFILAQNGDSVNFREQPIPYKDSLANNPILFTGNNAAMHYLYNKMNSNFGYKFNYIDSLLELNYPDGTNLYDTIVSSINKYLSPFDTLYKENKISKYFLGIIKSDFRNVMFMNTLENGGLKSLEKNNPWADPDGIDDFQRSIYRNAINNDPYLSHTNWGSAVLMLFNQDYNNLFRESDFPIKDSFLYNFGNVYKNFARLSSYYCENFWGYSLLFVKLEEPKEEFSFDTIFAYYKKKFPTSPYIKLIENKTKQITNILLKNEDIIIDTFSSVNSLQEIIHNRFKGTPVFVDLWASWCSPCKAEFHFNPQLDSLLHNKNTKKLFISIDNPNQKNQWEKSIYNFDLTGYHLLANKGLRSDIATKVYKNQSDLSIPRYILFDKNGVMVDDSMPRPSDINLLRKRLDELLR